MRLIIPGTLALLAGPTAIWAGEAATEVSAVNRALLDVGDDCNACEDQCGYGSYCKPSTGIAFYSVCEDAGIITGTCDTECTEDNDCSGDDLCKPSDGLCVDQECTTAAHCTDGSGGFCYSDGDCGYRDNELGDLCGNDLTCISDNCVRPGFDLEGGRCYLNPHTLEDEKVGHIIVHRETNNCGDMDNYAIPVTLPGAGQITDYDVREGHDFPGDFMQGIELVGPIEKGTWIQVGDSKNKFHADDSVSIVVTEDIPIGTRECYSTLEVTETTKDHSRFRRTARNGINGKVSMMRVWVPADVAEGDAAENILGFPQWSAEFSEENTGKSHAYGNYPPIVGLSCNYNDCDNKRVLAAAGSGIRRTSPILHTTSYKSEENNQWINCPEDYYVTRIQCSGSKCDNVRLICAKANSSWKISWGDWSVVTINSSSEGICPLGEVVTSLKCYNSYCGKIQLGCLKVERA